MIYRKIDSYLEYFYRETKMALLLDGARQVGKTTSIRHFGATHFKSFIEINFVRTPEAAGLFRSAAGADEIITRLSAFARRPLIPGQTLVFFDEVQKCPEIVTAIKFLVEEGSYRYILSGSLLGTELRGLSSAPVGFMGIRRMYPLDLEEFLRALGVQDRVFSALRESFEEGRPADSVIHGRLMQLFRLYLLVGGMPAAVARYLEHNNLQEVLTVQKSIIELYKLDISQYDPDRKLYIDEIFSLIPSELNAKNKRFILKHLNENFKFSRFRDSFLWLSAAGVALPVYNSEEPVAPLILSKSRNLFKLFENDVGLLASEYADGLQLRVLNNDPGINFGGIFENFTVQELSAHGLELYYFNSKKQGELDFVIEEDGSAVPIEVKSGKDYVRHNALTNVLENKDYDIRRAYVLCNDNVQKSGRITYLPMYMTMFIRNDRQEEKPLVYRPDLTGLA